MAIARVIAPESVTAAAGGRAVGNNDDESITGEQRALHPEAGAYRRAAAPRRLGLPIRAQRPRLHASPRPRQLCGRPPPDHG